MIITFDLVSPKTVPSTYSWDNGVPSATSPSLVDLTLDSEGYYVGYAPFVLIRLSSVPVFETGDDIYTVFRTINFGDYYNCNYNQLTSLGFDEDYYCHVYVMPGTYEASLTHTQYSTAFDLGEQPTIIYQQDAIDEYQAPVFDLISENDRGRIFWNWGKLACNSESSTEICDTGQGDLTITPITWKEAKCSEYYAKAWKDTKGSCFEAPPVLIPSDSISINIPNKLKIIELTPTAYLSAIQPDQLNRVSPLSATLTARFTKCGSFPIEKIVWDLGDGSPLLTQRRWSVLSSEPFVYSGAIAGDPSDPRNYDVKHVYKVTKDSGYTFYPSITAYAYSTGTTDCASAVIGPIQPQTYNKDTNKASLLQNNINDQKKFSILLQYDEDVVAAKFEK
jgi:hypothetical protein